MSAALETLLGHPAIWRTREARGARTRAGLATGFAALDACLPDGGWPVGALTEIEVVRDGIGELGLLLPALARLAAEDRWLAWVAPPHVPYAPALTSRGIDLARVLWIRAHDPTEQLWAAEQALRSGACGAVLAWPAPSDHRRLRRLQLAAEQGGSWGVLFRHGRTVAEATPAALRLRVAPAPDGGLEVEGVKCRGRAGWKVVIRDS